jgi:hypothetical protein
MHVSEEVYTQKAVKMFTALIKEVGRNRIVDHKNIEPALS